MANDRASRQALASPMSNDRSTAPRITVSVGARRVPVDELADPRLGAALRTAGLDIARRVAKIRCPVHKASATQVRIHFDPHGSADLQYDSCCEMLGERIGQSLA